MHKKILVYTSLFIFLVIISGCSKNINQNNESTNDINQQKNDSEEQNISATCKDSACFSMAMAECKPASFIDEYSSHIHGYSRKYYFEIIGKEKGLCKVKEKYIEDTRQLQEEYIGKEMICLYSDLKYIDYEKAEKCWGELYDLHMSPPKNADYSVTYKDLTLFTVNSKQVFQFDEIPKKEDLPLYGVLDKYHNKDIDTLGIIELTRKIPKDETGLEGVRFICNMSVSNEMNGYSGFRRNIHPFMNAGRNLESYNSAAFSYLVRGIYHYSIYVYDCRELKDEKINCTEINNQIFEWSREQSEACWPEQGYYYEKIKPHLEAEIEIEIK